MKKKAFITGISGQDGSYLAELLVENFQTVATDLGLSKIEDIQKSVDGATGQVIVATIISQNSGSSGNASNMNIDGSGQTEYWSNDETPDERGGTSGYDVYQYSIIKTGAGNSYLVLANRTYCD